MGKRVYVVKKMVEYGSSGFNWKQQEFRDLLDNLGCDTNGEVYSDQFECPANSFEKALNIIKTYKEKGECDKVKDFLEEVGLDIDGLEDSINELGNIDDVIYAMQCFLDTRDKTCDYIMFECW